MLFANRQEAAIELAKRLDGYRAAHPLILAIPRGAVPMGRTIADALGGDLDVVLVHKLGAPGQPELAMGAVDEKGRYVLNDVARDLGVSDDYVRAEAERQAAILRERRRLFTPSRAPLSAAGRVAIVVDDGVATGATMSAAIQVVRSQKPERIVAAMAVAPPDTVRRMRREADEVVCLRMPPRFHAVGEFFREFRQVDDAEAMHALAGSPGTEGS